MIGNMSLRSTSLKAYTQPHQFEPLLPARGLDELAARTRAVVEASHRLQGMAHATTRAALRELVRSMNSYYSNLIEGQSTHPLNIERALTNVAPSREPDTARRQRLAVAHIDAERELELQCKTEREALASTFLMRCHGSLDSRLSEPDRRTDKEGHPVEPGQLRNADVAVARQQAPAWAAVPAFLARADEMYAKDWRLDRLLVAVACAHHRLMWVHPFVDGNGRAVRLQTHCAMQALTAGLWSVNRGLARRRDEYYTHLSNADMARQGDLDGRGNLSERMLLAWCDFFIAICEDQVALMTRMLDLGDVKKRLDALVTVRAKQRGGDGYRDEAVLALHHVFAAGPVARGEFVQLTGLGERTGRKVLAALLADGLLASDTPKGEVRLGLPLDALNILMPNLYPEAATALEE